MANDAIAGKITRVARECGPVSQHGSYSALGSLSRGAGEGFSLTERFGKPADRLSDRPAQDRLVGVEGKFGSLGQNPTGRPNPDPLRQQTLRQRLRRLPTYLNQRDLG